MWPTHTNVCTCVCMRTHRRRGNYISSMHSDLAEKSQSNKHTYTRAHQSAHRSSISNLISGELWSCITHDGPIKSQGCRMSYVIQYEINVKFISGKWQGHHASIFFPPCNGHCDLKAQCVTFPQLLPASRTGPAAACRDRLTQFNDNSQHLSGFFFCHPTDESDDPTAPPQSVQNLPDSLSTQKTSAHCNLACLLDQAIIPGRLLL